MEVNKKRSHSVVNNDTNTQLVTRNDWMPLYHGWLPLYLGCISGVSRACQQCASSASRITWSTVYSRFYGSAARLVLQLPKRSHALERMQAELHWLVCPHRLYYNVGVIWYKCHGWTGSTQGSNWRGGGWLNPPPPSPPQPPKPTILVKI